MIKLNLMFTYMKDLEYINVYHGLVIHCKDTKQTFYVNSNLKKIEITLNTVLLNNKAELDNIISPILSRVYIIINDEELYKYTNRWIKVETEQSLLDIVESSVDYLPSILSKNGDYIAPKTLASAVYMNDGSRLSASLDRNHITVTRTKAIYVEAEIDRQKVFNIPYPISNYDFGRNHISIIIRGSLTETDKYVINNDKLILNSTIEPLNKGEVVLFIFYYTTILDLNDNVVLTTKNYEDKSITTEKLSDNIRIQATNISETPRRFFITPEEREKLNGIDYGATRYIHPETHPATMIVEDDNHQFITIQEREQIQKLAFKDDIYTKEEVEEKLVELFQHIMGDATPETLDTLKELAAALGNDPNFATTILEKISVKADQTEIVRLEEEMESKISVTDYLKTGIYNTPVKSNIYDIDHYRVSIKDLKLQEYIDGMPIAIKIEDTNKGPALLQINALDPKPILTQDLYPLIKGELKVGSIYNLRYNGSTGNFILQGKGGVNLVNTTQKEYEVDINETINRGDLLDLINGKVRKSIPRFKLLSNHKTKDPKFNADGKLNTISLNDNVFISFWKEGNILKSFVFNTMVNGDFIEGNIHNSDPLIINLDCSEYTVEKLSSKQIAVSFITTLRRVTLLILNINDDGEISLGHSSSYNELDPIFNIRIIRAREGKFLFGYQFDDKTKIMYFRIKEHDVEVLSSRTNVDYILDYHCRINDEQILFAGPVDNKIEAWVMNVNSQDFDYTTLSTIVEDVNNVDEYDNIVFTIVEDNVLLANYTTNDNSKLLKQILTIEYNGNIDYKEPEIISEDMLEIENDFINNRINLYDNIFIRVSNYDIERPELEDDNNKYMKVILEHVDTQTENILEKYTVIPYLFNEISYTMLNDKKLLISFTARDIDTENYRLMFSIIEIKKKPDMIATSSAIEGEFVLVSEW